jgi:hypothetical protein
VGLPLGSDFEAAAGVGDEGVPLSVPQQNAMLIVIPTRTTAWMLPIAVHGELAGRV